jgi:ankyrin repeat protein
MTKDQRKLLDASKSGNFKNVEQLLKAGVDVNFQDPQGLPKNRTALMSASENGHLEVVELLLKAGAKVNATDKGIPIDCPGGNTALILAIQKGHVQIAHRLLGAGASPKIKGGGTSVINAAAYLGEETLVKRLLELGADANQQDGSGNVPIVSAVLNGKVNIVKLLLDLHCDPNSLFPGGMPLLRVAASEGNLELCKLLGEYGADPDLGDFTPLMAACDAVSLVTVKHLLSLGVNVNKQDSRRHTALDIVKQMLKPEDLSPEFRERLIQLGEYVPPPVERLKSIENLLLKAGAKTAFELSAPTNSTRGTEE